jgi:hypothetical protein
MKSTHPKQTHLGDPKTTEFIDHKLEIVAVDNSHKYQLRCVDCNKHIKWATETEWLWCNYSSGKYKPRPARFRQLYWAPRYDELYQFIQSNLDEKNSQLDYVPKKLKLIKPQELGI